MNKRAALLLVAVALLAALTAAGRPAGSARAQAAPELVRAFLPAVVRRVSPPAPSPEGCPFGVWVSREAIPVLQQYGSYTHTNKMDQAANFFPELEGTATIRTLRAVSLAQMEQLADDAIRLGIPFEAVTYDLEGWDQTPEWEKENQVEATRLARDIAHSRGKLLIMGPARAFTWRNWPQMAPLADMWVIQAQGGQRQNPAGPAFRAWLQEYVDMLRPYHPDMPIWAQLSTAPDTPLTLDGYMAYVDSVYPALIDGVYVFNPGHQPLAAIWQRACGQ